jgi:hypothetical protein
VLFDRGVVVYQTTNFSEDIVGSSHRFYGGRSAHNALLLSSGRVMTFYEKAQPDGTVTYDAFVMGTSRQGDQNIVSDVTRYECVVPR